MTAVASMSELEQHVGAELGVSQWMTISQARVNQFAEATLDNDWMHIDEEKARQGPVGETIGQGFLTLSLLTYFSHELSFLPGNIEYAYNYGLDRVRWLTPLRVGKRIRNRMSLLSVERRGDGLYLIKTQNTVEIEGEERPAMVAEWLGLIKGA